MLERYSLKITPLGLRKQQRSFQMIIIKYSNSNKRWMNERNKSSTGLLAFRQIFPRKPRLSWKLSDYGQCYLLWWCKLIQVIMACCSITGCQLSWMYTAQMWWQRDLFSAGASQKISYLHLSRICLLFWMCIVGHKEVLFVISWR